MKNTLVGVLEVYDRNSNNAASRSDIKRRLGKCLLSYRITLKLSGF